MSRLLLAGYFGCGNHGDDAILLGFLAGIAEHGHTYSVLAAQPERMMSSYGLRAIPRMDMGQIKTAIDECDALVFPGGSIFQDVSSVRSVYYYARLVKMAKKAGKKVILLGQGIGPLNTWLGKKIAVGAFNSCSAIAVRDPESMATLRNLGVKVMPQLTADMAFLLPEPRRADDTADFGLGSMKAVGIAPRPWGKDKGKSLVPIFADLCRLLMSAGYMPLMIEMDENEDRPLIMAMGKLAGGKIPELKNVAGPVQFQQRLQRMEAVIAMRLHAGILAASVGVPPMMIAYDPKVTAFANSLGLAPPLGMQGLSAQRIFDDFQQFIKTRDKSAEAVARRRTELIQQSQRNIEILQNTLG